jgi:hypothetical protein
MNRLSFTIRSGCLQLYRSRGDALNPTQAEGCTGSYAGVYRRLDAKD